MKLSNDVEKYETEVNKMGQNYYFFLTVRSTPVVLLVVRVMCDGSCTECWWA